MGVGSMQKVIGLRHSIAVSAEMICAAEQAGLLRCRAVAFELAVDIIDSLRGLDHHAPDTVALHRTEVDGALVVTHVHYTIDHYVLLSLTRESHRSRLIHPQLSPIV